MLGRIALFELRYQLRRPIAWISFVLFAALAFGLVTPGVFSSRQVPVNAPIAITLTIGLFSILGMFLSLATLADVALRDIETRMDAIVRSKPVSSALYFSARFVGAYTVACLAFIGAVLGNVIACYMPWVHAGAVGPFRIEAYGLALAEFALPNLFVTGAMFFAVASLTRSLLATYLSALLLFILYAGTQILLSNLEYRTLATLLDPFGLKALLTDTSYWTVAERKLQIVPLDGLLLQNRLLWLGIGGLLLMLSLVLLNAGERRLRAPRLDLTKAAASPIIHERPVIAVGGVGVWDELVAVTRHETTAILRTWTFFVLLILGVLLSVGSLYAVGQLGKMPSLPVTSVVVSMLAGSFAFVVLLVPIAYGGELIWRDRKVKIAELIDATPVPTFVLFISKILAVVLVIVALLAVAMITGIVFQLFNGITDIDIGIYLVKLFLEIGLPAVLFGVLAILIQTVVNQKFVGLLVMIAVLVCVPFASVVGIENQLLVLFDLPDIPLSDMDRYGHYLSGAMWFAAYWTCVAVLIAIGAYLIWIRGTGSLWTRIKRAHLSVTPAVASIAGVALAGTAATAGYIYWNTRIVNEYASTQEREEIQVAYERAYRQSETLPQPRISDFEIAVDLNPDQRGFRSRGRYTLVNQTNQPIETVHLVMPTDKVEQLELQDADLSDKQPRFNVFEFRPRTPFAPGETRTLTFAASESGRGFQTGQDSTPVIYNGTFAHSPNLAPLIGIQHAFYLQSAERRNKYGLKPLPGIALRNNKEQLRRNFITGDSHFIRYTITVSTSSDQIALAPGHLERKWTEGDRHFFRYVMETPALNFWSVVSGRYTVARDKWNDVDLAVYHDPKHGMNVPRMLDAMKQALAYYSANFGPFPHRQLRIAEFPKTVSGTVAAQSFPTMIPYSEAFGFTANLKDAGTIDYLWHITAHEVAHQWWGHQVAGANVEGAQFLSESLSEYSALMVAEHRYGPHKMRQYLKYELDTYLLGHGRSTNEHPLARAAMDQSYVHYQKGALALYALKDAIGEARLNGALAQLIRVYAYKADPYPTSLDFLKLVRAAAGPAYQQLITDLFDKITLWDLRVVSSDATEAGDGKWRVRVQARAKKLEAASNGTEKEVPLEQPIDIGLFAADPGESGFDAKDVIALEKRSIKSGVQTVEFVVDRKPAFVGIDPYVKLISRQTKNNVARLLPKP